MVRAGVITDRLWAILEGVLPPASGRVGRPWNDHRRTLEGIAWRYRTGSPWRDVPAEFGAWQSLWYRHRRWSTDGTYERMLEQILAATPADDPDVVALVSVDATIVRAHQHAAGARRGEPSTLRGGWLELHESARAA